MGRCTDQGGGGGRDGTEGEPELRVLDTVGEPTVWTVSGAVGKPANNELTLYALLYILGFGLGWDNIIFKVPVIVYTMIYIPVIPIM